MQDTQVKSNDQVNNSHEFQENFLEWQRKDALKTSAKNLTAGLTGENLNILEDLIGPEKAQEVILNQSINDREHLTLNPNGRPLSELRVVGRNLFNWGLQKNQPIPSVAKTAAKVTAEKIILGSTDKRFNLSKQCAGNSLDFFANIA